jgi:hypothetical protein
MKEMLQQPPAEPECQESPDVDSPPSPNREIRAEETPQAPARQSAQPVAAPSANGVLQTELSLPPELLAALLDLAMPSPIGEIGNRLGDCQRPTRK